MDFNVNDDEEGERAPPPQGWLQLPPEENHPSPSPAPPAGEEGFGVRDWVASMIMMLGDLLVQRRKVGRYAVG